MAQFWYSIRRAVAVVLPVKSRLEGGDHVVWSGQSVVGQRVTDVESDYLVALCLELDGGNHDVSDGVLYRGGASRDINLFDHARA